MFTIFVRIALAIVGIIATLAAYGGETWDKDAKTGAFVRVNLRGWITLVCLALSFLGTVGNELADHNEKVAEQHERDSREAERTANEAAREKQHAEERDADKREFEQKRANERAADQLAADTARAQYENRIKELQRRLDDVGSVVRQVPREIAHPFYSANQNDHQFVTVDGKRLIVFPGETLKYFAPTYNPISKRDTRLVIGPDLDRGGDGTRHAIRSEGTILVHGRAGTPHFVRVEGDHRDVVLKMSVLSSQRRSYADHPSHDEPGIEKK